MSDNNDDEERMIGEYSLQHLLNHASKLIEEKVEVTEIFDQQAEERIPKFQEDELTLGRVLGRGGFCVVNEVTSIELFEEEEEEAYHEHDEEDADYIVQNRTFMSKYCIRQGNHARYAVKKLSKATLKDPQLLVKGLVDLVLEAKFLSVIKHGHIIKMRAVMMMGEEENDNATTTTRMDPNYFVVLDRLYETLPAKLLQWKQRTPSGLFSCCGAAQKANEIWLERLGTAYDLASALVYLHSQHIVYRDLKPDNIRFDVRGDVKIFDFGLARQVNPKDANEDGLYNLTGDTGSIMYMAPEVALSKPYNMTADVYSFDVLLWQLLTSDEPYQGFTLNLIETRIIQQGGRPKLKEEWSLELQDCMACAWSPNIAKRPTMEEMSQTLREEIVQVSNEREARMHDFSDASRHSLHSLQSAASSKE